MEFFTIDLFVQYSSTVLISYFTDAFTPTAEVYEDPTIQQPVTNRNKTQTVRRPLLLKEKTADQNPSATNEDERKRHSKKFSASIKQNQLEEVLKKAKSKEEFDDVTEGLPKTTIDGKDPIPLAYLERKLQ